MTIPQEIDWYYEGSGSVGEEVVVPNCPGQAGPGDPWYVLVTVEFAGTNATGSFALYTDADVLVAGPYAFNIAQGECEIPSCNDAIFM